MRLEWGKMIAIMGCCPIVPVPHNNSSTSATLRNERFSRYFERLNNENLPTVSINTNEPNIENNEG